MVKVKICGLTSEEDILMCDELGADFLGFILVRESLRFVSNLNIIKRKTRAYKVAVMRNPSIQDINALPREFDFVQLHGFENEEVVKAIKENGKGVIKAIFPDIPESLSLCSGLAELVDFFLVDSSNKSKGVMSGRFDERAVANIIHDGAIFGRPFFISGGLTPDNVLETILKFKPFGVDVSSGVESRPGKKSRDIVEKFIKKVKMEE